LDRLVRAGKVRYLGASNFRGFQLQHAIDVATYRNLEPFRCFQPLYNLLDRAPEWEMIPVCQQNGLGVIPWSPLRGGWLTGKFRRGMAAPPTNTRVQVAEEQGWSESWSAYANEHTWSVLDEVLTIAGELGRTPAQVALNWLSHRPGVTAPIVGARDLRQLDDNLGTVGWKLDPDQAARLTKVSELTVPEPYRMLTGPDRLRTGREAS
jgi:aryl-alcohol dehydrogenase-like predicted oxidoreductase